MEKRVQRLRSGTSPQKLGPGTIFRRKLSGRRVFYNDEERGWEVS